MERGVGADVCDPAGLSARPPTCSSKNACDAVCLSLSAGKHPYSWVCQTTGEPPPADIQNACVTQMAALKKGTGILCCSDQTCTTQNYNCFGYTAPACPEPYACPPCLFPDTCAGLGANEVTYCPSQTDLSTCFTTPVKVDDASLKELSVDCTPPVLEKAANTMCNALSGGTHPYAAACVANKNQCTNGIQCCTNVDCEPDGVCYTFPKQLCSPNAPPPDTSACPFVVPLASSMSTTYPAALYKSAMLPVINQLSELLPALKEGADTWACAGKTCSGTVGPLFSVQASSTLADAQAMLATLNNIITLFYPGSPTPPPLLTIDVNLILNTCTPGRLTDVKASTYNAFKAAITNSPLQSVLLTYMPKWPGFTNVFQISAYLVNWAYWKPCMQNACMNANGFAKYDPNFCPYDLKSPAYSTTINDCDAQVSAQSMRVLFASQILQSVSDRAAPGPSAPVPVSSTASRQILSSPATQESLPEIMIQTLYNAYCT